MNIKYRQLLYIHPLILFLACCKTPLPETISTPPFPTDASPYSHSTQVDSYLSNLFEPIDTQIRAADGMKMVYVPAGEFRMGSTNEQIEQIVRDCSDRYGTPGECQQEVDGGLRPVHSVSLDSFWLDQTEVTYAMYTAFLNNQGDQSKDGVAWFEPGAGHRGIVYGYIREHDGVFETLEPLSRIKTLRNIRTTFQWPKSEFQLLRDSLPELKYGTPFQIDLIDRFSK